MSTNRLIAFLSILIVITVLLVTIIQRADSLDTISILLAAVLGGLVREVGSLLPKGDDKEDKD